MDPLVAGAASPRPTPPGHICKACRTEKNGARSRINVAAHQEKKENKNTDKREAGKEEKRQLTDFRATACCPSTVVQRAARQKMVCMKGVSGVTGTLRKANRHLDPSETGLGTAPPR